MKLDLRTDRSVIRLRGFQVSGIQIVGLRRKESPYQYSAITLFSFGPAVPCRGGK